MLHILDQYSNILSNSLLLFLISLRSILHSEQFLKILFRYPHSAIQTLLKKLHVRFILRWYFLLQRRFSIASSILLYILSHIPEMYLLGHLLCLIPENISYCHLLAEMLDVHSRSVSIIPTKTPFP